MPTRRRKCPLCKRLVIITSRPLDRARVLLTEEQATIISAEWDERQVRKDIIDSFGEQLVDAEYNLLKSRFGHEPEIRDIKWSLLQKEMLKHAADWNWGLYGNAKLAMAKMLNKEKKYEQALAIFLEICYHDLNGGRNIGESRHNAKLLAQFPAFEPGNSFLAPGIISEIRSLITSLSLGPIQVREMFVGHAARECKAFSMPLSPDEAWLMLAKELPIQSD